MIEHISYSMSPSSWLKHISFSLSSSFSVCLWLRGTLMEEESFLYVNAHMCAGRMAIHFIYKYTHVYNSVLNTSMYHSFNI